MLRERLKQQVQVHQKTVFRFIVVGSLAAFTNLFCFILFHELLRIHYLFATCAAYCIATGLHFSLSRYFTFNSKSAFSHQIPKYMMAVALHFVITLIIVWSTVNLLHLPAIAGVVLAIGTTVVMSYCLQRFWVFI